ncbi:MAG: DnaD domain protein [Dehalococcoidales bacterium]|jgi:DnaD/phage-associated family protein
MKQFNGFPAKMEFNALPKLFYSALLPHISDINELKVTLHLFKELLQKRGNLRFSSFGEMRSSVGLRTSLSCGERPFETVLSEALAMATGRGTFLELVVTQERKEEKLYFINTEANHQAIEKLKNGELEIGSLKPAEPAAEIPEPSDIFSLYEENIGMLTPIIADQLKQAEQDYPLTWIKEAIEEAVLYNKRHWQYIARILENWSREGKSHGTYRQDSEKKTGIDKYFKGKYGHMVQH